jgi:hypothetical protein
MAIKIKEETPEKLTAEFSEVELNALRFVSAKWGFKDETGVLQFALAVLFRAQHNTVEFKDEKGKKQKLSPAASIMKSPGVTG